MRTRIGVLLVVSFTLTVSQRTCFADTADTKNADPADLAWKALFAKPALAANRARLDAVLRAVGHDAAAIRRLIAADTTYPAQKSGWNGRRLRTTEDGKTREDEFFLRVPAKYTPAKPWPMILAAHWQRGTGRAMGQAVEQLLGQAKDEFLIVAPTLSAAEDAEGADKDQAKAKADDGPVFRADPAQMDGYWRALAWTRLNCHVDDDRIFALGYDQGASVVWNLACRRPDVFAGVVPLAGAPFFRGAPYTMLSYLENLSPTPVWCIWGAADGAEPDQLGVADACRTVADKLKALGHKGFRGVALPGKGRYRCWPRQAELLTFLRQHRRNVAPAAFRYAFHEPAHSRGRFVAALAVGWKPIDFSKPFRVGAPAPHGGKPTPREAVEVIGGFLDRRRFTFEVTRDAKANRLTIVPRGVSKVRVYLQAGLFDEDENRPAEIRFGKAVWKGRILPSAECLLLHYAATRDATAPILNEIDLSLDGQTRVRFDAESVRHETPQSAR